MLFIVYIVLLIYYTMVFNISLFIILGDIDISGLLSCESLLLADVFQEQIGHEAATHGPLALPDAAGDEEPLVRPPGPA